MKKLNEAVSYAAIIIGALLVSFSVACILLPSGAIDYGTAGIGIIIGKLTGFNLSICVFLVTLPFLIAGFVVLGFKFGLKSIVGVISYTVGLEVFENIPFELQAEHFIAVVFGGAILGAGLSLILRFGGCIDGSEIFANIFVNKLSEKTGKNFSMTGLLIAFNACVYIAAFLFINENSALLSLLVYVIATAVIDHFTDHFDAIKQLTIITQNPDTLIKAIREEFNKTCTVINSQGAIAGENKTLICYVTYFELQKMREIIKRQDTKAFITVSTVDEIMQ